MSIKTKILEILHVYILLIQLTKQKKNIKMDFMWINYKMYLFTLYSQYFTEKWPNIFRHIAPEKIFWQKKIYNAKNITITISKLVKIFSRNSLSQRGTLPCKKLRAMPDEISQKIN